MVQCNMFDATFIKALMLFSTQQSLALALKTQLETAAVSAVNVNVNYRSVLFKLLRTGLLTAGMYYRWINNSHMKVNILASAID